ncbi:zinc finger protein 622 isoform X2 [Heterocephalus glaber]|uniref:Cytoplasmic 60S subunit biogenesis factor ZNF622 n=1 Tax=Heterocephalus glaber TaxID=10181 RepID=A0AAX6SZS2_HETGA|nr:zinc finger protein 622 isoform X2 [Heterocephalus glaber]
MATYTCITCRVAFRDAEMQRAHYKTDWHRYNLRRKVAGMAPVTAEGFQERVRAQRAVAAEESKGTATYCTVCSKKFGSFNAYENHLKSRRHVELEKKAVQAVNRKVEMMNEKNLEKGLGVDGVNKDAMNAAIQQAIKAQPSLSPKKAPPAPAEESSGAVAAGGRGAHDRDPAEKPPRLQWFEQQAKKLAKQQGEESEEEEEEEDPDEEDWEDIDSEEEMELEDDEGMDDVQGPNAKEGEAGESPALGAIPVTDCLFCSHHSSSLVKNVAHMTKVHSFFIPDIEYLSDLKGLIKYLGEKVGVGKICLWCNEKGKSFYSTEAVQAHMSDKSHCKLFTDGDAALEFADFYDFRCQSGSPLPDEVLQAAIRLVKSCGRGQKSEGRGQGPAAVPSAGVDWQHRQGPGAREGHAVRPEDEVQVDAEDWHEEQRHQADALPGPSEVLSLRPRASLRELLRTAGPAMGRPFRSRLFILSL